MDQVDFEALKQILWSRKTPKSLTGFSDFTNQIDAMGLSHLLSPYSKTSTTKQTTTSQLAKNETVGTDSLTNNWWYIGE